MKRDYYVAAFGVKVRVVSAWKVAWAGDGDGVRTCGLRNGLGSPCRVSFRPLISGVILIYAIASRRCGRAGVRQSTPRRAAAASLHY